MLALKAGAKQTGKSERMFKSGYIYSINSSADPAHCGTGRLLCPRCLPSLDEKRETQLFFDGAKNGIYQGTSCW